MKKARGVNTSPTTTLLDTPVGVFHGEYLGKSNEESTRYDRGFYTLCKLDNYYIFEIGENNQCEIPPMTLQQLNHILFSKMKQGKACDIYHLTVEHLRHCGTEAKENLLILINRILHDIYFLSCPQLKICLDTTIFKGRGKPAAKPSSYKRITMTPIVGAIVDFYLDPKAETVFKPRQNPDQLGFT